MRLVGAAVPAVLPLFLLAGCGFVGPVLPPSPMIPNPVSDLSAVERGDQILITFRTPARTTDSLAIKNFSEIDLRVGATVMPFDFDRWAAAAKPYTLTLSGPNDPDDPQPVPLSLSIPVGDWTGQRIAIAVRTAVKKTDHYSSWSNRVVLEIVSPVAAPAVKAESAAEGVVLSWNPYAPDLQYRIMRQGPGDKVPNEIGTSQKSTFVDTTAQFESKYTYSVIALKGSAESLPSEPQTIIPKDTFPPSVPTAVTALAGPDSIEVSWQRSPEADLKGYYLYRSVSGGTAERLGGLITLPTYSDRAAERGKTYQYAVSAVDKNDNESAKSAPAQASF